jgi:uncharacterized protein with PIN domain
MDSFGLFLGICLSVLIVILIRNAIKKEAEKEKSEWVAGHYKPLGKNIYPKCPYCHSEITRPQRFAKTKTYRSYKLYPYYCFTCHSDFWA